MSFNRNNIPFTNRTTTTNNRRRSQNRSLNIINPSTTVPNDLRVLLNLYISMYNNVNEQIDLLYEDLDMIRNNMQTVIQMILENNTQINDSSRNINRPNLNPRQTERQNRSGTLSNIFQGLRERERETPRGRQSTREEPIIQYDNDRNRIYINNIPYTIENVEYYNTTASTNTNENQNRYREILQSFLDPIAVRPTPYQISNATRNINYGVIENPLNLSCPISLETFELDHDVTQIIHCGHIFNEDSLNQWFQSNVRCPVCRYDIRTNNLNNTREEEEKKEDDNDDMPSLTTILEEEEKEEEPIRNTLEHLEQEYTREIENLLQNTANSLTNLFSTEFEIQYRTDLSNNPTRLLDPSNNVFLFETLFSIPPGNFRF